MQFTDHNREYRLVREGDSERDRMAMELIAVRENKTVAEIFYSSTDGEFTISVYEPKMPLSVIEQLIGSARVALLPTTKVHDR